MNGVPARPRDDRDRHFSPRAGENRPTPVPVPRPHLSVEGTGRFQPFAGGTGVTSTRRRAIQGAVFGTASALAWVLLECAVGLHPGREITRMPFLYAYLLLGALTGFTLFGGILGRSEDRLREANARLDELAVSDPLTGLRNVRYFRPRMAEAEAQARRSGHPLSLIVIDLDHFKAVNDRFGHEAGDAVLRETARAIASVVREGDTAARLEGFVARMGGEEFAVLLPETTAEAALAVARRVLRAIARCRIPADGGEVRVTASAGVATLHGEADAPPGLYARADRAMYGAKLAGRNRAFPWREEHAGPAAAHEPRPRRAGADPVGTA